MQRILAVDDDKDILEVLQYVLEDSGYEVETLADAHFLFDRIKAHHPDLIILDIMLGNNMDGRQLCRDVKAKLETHDIPVILISASHSADTKNQNGNPDDFIAKPFDINVLLSSVEKHLAAA